MKRSIFDYINTVLAALALFVACLAYCDTKILRGQQQQIAQQQTEINQFNGVLNSLDNSNKLLTKNVGLLNEQVKM